MTFNMRWIKLTHVGFRAHVKIAFRIVSYIVSDSDKVAHLDLNDMQMSDCLTFVGQTHGIMFDCGVHSLHAGYEYQIPPHRYLVGLI